MYLLDRFMYEEIGRRLGGYTAEEITNLTNEEIKNALATGHGEHLRLIIEERKKGFLVIQHGDTIRVYSGTEAHEMAKQEIGEASMEQQAAIRGTIASKGKAAGPVRIIETNQDLHKIIPGDVMITFVTRQDFVPAMKKCVAIVTDEGGITNHAAIVSREFGLPCLVGAKNAVQTFKDGDMVEVDAENGNIRLRQ